MTIKIIELFSGIGGFTKGFQDAGFEIDKHLFSEIDKHAIANYKYNFPNAEYIGSVTNFRGQRGQADIITFGSPCQDFSLAGKRAGLQGQRSSLIGHAIRIISEVKPSVFIWENVKGAYSSNAGADFWAILQAFTNIGGYRLEWQLLNTKWFLPQNRERIYLIGHLAESERSFGNVFPFREEIRVYHQRHIKKPNQIASTLNANDEKIWVGNFLKIKSATSKGYEEAIVGDSINLSNPNSTTRRGRVGKSVAQTLETSCNQAVVQNNEDWTVGTLRTHNDSKGFRKMSDDNSPTISARAREDGSGQPVIQNKNSIRRLTEIECERLQGFPDDWTKFGSYDGTIKEIPKTQRYKMLGNAVTVRVVEEIAKRLITQ